jgi:hypothetical protein
MRKRKSVIVGSKVRNILTGECGVVVEIIGNPIDPFGYMVETQKGIKRWILRKKVEPSSKPS